MVTTYMLPLYVAMTCCYGNYLMLPWHVVMNVSMYYNCDCVAMTCCYGNYLYVAVACCYDMSMLL